MSELGRGGIVVIISYTTAAVIAILLSLSPPAHVGLLVHNATIESIDSSVAVLNGGSLVITEGGALKLHATGMTCQHGDRVFIASGGEIVALKASEGRATRFRLAIEGWPLAIGCNEEAVALAMSSGGPLSIYVLRLNGTAERLDGALPRPLGPLGIAVGKSIYLHANGVIAEISERPKAYRLPNGLEVYGIAEHAGSPVVYGARESRAVVYLLQRGVMIELAILGRESRAEAASCEGQWCRLLIVPEGDWIRIAEFNNWRYVGGAKVVGLKGMIYRKAGAGERPWFSAEVPAVGTTAISLHSIGRAVLGDERRDLYRIEQTVPPKIERFRVPAEETPLTLSRVRIEVQSEEIRLERTSTEYSFLRAREDLIGKIFTAVSLSSPLIAYAIREAISPRGSA